MDLEKRIFSGFFSLVAAILYMELRDIQSQLKALEYRFEQYIELQEEMDEYRRELNLKYPVY